MKNVEVDLMLTFKYTIQDEMGIHARPAGLLVKKVKSLESKVTIAKDEKTVDASKLMALMGMGIKKGEEITVSVDGGDNEVSDMEEIQKFLKENL